ncbi:MAG: hypothetical protein U1F53_17100 [Burkholderiaceae bacterium]
MSTRTSTRPLHSLDAWPGESARPPLRLLEPRGPAQRAGEPPARPGLGAGWLQRLRQALK